ncbi:MAG: fructosamine kinase family protein [Chloroherpetonaceae bacterium]|nr:fructosamine kinase family protein [Chloroherpetonaceae bacterium]
MTDSDLARALESKLGKSVSILSRRRVGGGCIHRAERVETNVGTFFVKHNDASQRENFEAEADGLKVLAETATLRVPQVIAVLATERESALAMEFVSTAPMRSDFWEIFGERLARLHSHSRETFGYERDNFIGSLPQSNRAHAEWSDFFREERLSPMLRLALKTGNLSPSDARRFERLFPKLDGLIPNEKPALLHGDLWSGNYLVDERGMPVVIDPAVYFGHREAELAFMRLFGGFDERLFEAYHSAFPLERGWRERVALFNLYPLLVHLNLFGRSYWSAIDAALKKFGA